MLQNLVWVDDVMMIKYGSSNILIGCGLDNTRIVMMLMRDEFCWRL